uniref:Uncharacterized protein n=1 Tax=Ananas comosus var. bracteatus TaxID=296719 RepID=A0A6V7P4H0_ANACO|nr:unnamed protein product [Ananas comosus var. bracteatus]
MAGHLRDGRGRGAGLRRGRADNVRPESANQLRLHRQLRFAAAEPPKFLSAALTAKLHRLNLVSSLQSATALQPMTAAAKDAARRAQKKPAAAAVTKAKAAAAAGTDSSAEVHFSYLEDRQHIEQMIEELLDSNLYMELSGSPQ